MNNILLCEGATDAILLSYYLEAVFGWMYCTPDKSINISEDYNETVNWYKKGNDKLVICSVGGKDRFGNFFSEKVLDPITLSDAFDKVVIVTDRDKYSISHIENKMNKVISPLLSEKSSVSIENRKWTLCYYQNRYGIRKQLQSLLIVIPSESEGALESLMLDSISENPYDAIIVDKVKSFVHDMKSYALKYIASDRLELKADLGVTWAIQYPEKVFRLIDEQIRSVRWEESEVLYDCFGILGEL